MSPASMVFPEPILSSEPSRIFLDHPLKRKIAVIPTCEWSSGALLLKAAFSNCSLHGSELTETGECGEQRLNHSEGE
jgi:hypothetical protein